MRQSPRNAKEKDLLLRLIEHKRLVTVVSALVREVERLNEDNLQLRAAVAMYREITSRHSFPLNPPVNHTSLPQG